MPEEKIKQSYDLYAAAPDAGKRLDKFVAERLGEAISRSQIQKLIQSENISVGGRPAKPHYKLKDSDRIVVNLPEPPPADIKPEAVPLDVIYEDEDIAVINKPAGLSVHPAGGRNAGTLVNALLHHYKTLSALGGASRPGIVHRLDKDTSGLMVIAKSDRAYKNLQRQFAAREVKKIYIAVVRGVIRAGEGVIDAPVGRSASDRKKMAVRYLKSRAALTHYRVIKRMPDATVVEVNLKTGRTHQIRVHMAHIGYPVLGDSKYGTKSGLPRMMLHAKKLGFAHPASGKYIEFDSALPGEMQVI